jgi:hypothetical protein
LLANSHFTLLQVVLTHLQPVAQAGELAQLPVSYRLATQPLGTQRTSDKVTSKVTRTGQSQFLVSIHLQSLVQLEATDQVQETQAAV